MLRAGCRRSRLGGYQAPRDAGEAVGLATAEGSVREGGGRTDGRALTSVLQPLAELPALPDPQLLLLLLPGGSRRVGPGGLHDGGVRSGVQRGSGRLHCWRGGGKRPAAVAGKRGASGASSPGESPGRGGDSGLRASGRRGRAANKLRVLGARRCPRPPHPCPRRRGAGGARCRLPALPVPSPPRRAPPPPGAALQAGASSASPRHGGLCLLLLLLPEPQRGELSRDCPKPEPSRRSPALRVPALRSEAASASPPLTQVKTQLLSAGGPAPSPSAFALFRDQDRIASHRRLSEPAAPMLCHTQSCLQTALEHTASHAEAWG